MKRKTNELTIAEAINLLLNAYGIKDKLMEVRLINSWEKITGTIVSNLTSGLSIKNKILFVKCKSAPLRHELSYHKTDLIQKLNEEAGGKVIEDIVFQ
ncbi:MAG TPA: DUF721 domain-containing protein [Bacteroidales bacterium]|nr:DUF721 domain-containing protein [Bacteroidales bacterium]